MKVAQHVKVRDERMPPVVAPAVTAVTAVAPQDPSGHQEAPSAEPPSWMALLDPRTEPDADEAILTIPPAGMDTVTNGSIIHVNAIDSAFGRGWGLQGVQDLYVSPDGSVTINDGNGNAQNFERHEMPPVNLSSCVLVAVTERFLSLAGDDSTLVKQANGNYVRRMGDGSVCSYSAPSENAAGDRIPGKLLTVADRYGNTTTYDYDADGKLLRITDPVGLETRFDYSGDHITRITDPANRVTLLVYSGKDLTSITDPDGSVRQFSYDTKGHLITETNKLGGVETNTFDEHGRAIMALRPDGTTVEVTPLEVQNLVLTEDTLDKDNPAAVSTAKLDDFRATYTQPNGNVITVTLNDRGQVMEESDALGLGRVDDVGGGKRGERPARGHPPAHRPQGKAGGHRGDPADSGRVAAVPHPESVLTHELGHLVGADLGEPSHLVHYYLAERLERRDRQCVRRRLVR